MTYEKYPVPADRESNEYATPRWVTKRIAETLPTEGATFDLDSASGAENEPHADEQYTIEDDGLTSEWFGWVFCNPPWSSPSNDGRMKEAWLRRATGHYQNGNVDGIVMLLPDDVSTQWFEDYGSTADYVTFMGRIQFGGLDRNPSFGVMLMTWGDIPRETVNVLADMGPTFRGPSLDGEQTTLGESDDE